jgi:hypothetical protein
MDSLITAAARALAAGDPLGALDCVALRNDPGALALRAIALAQLGEYPRARELLRLAARAFGPREPVARARCVVAEAEVALASRELGASARALEDACGALEAGGDRVNAVHGRLVAVRRLLLLGQVERAEEALVNVDLAGLPPMLEAIGRLVVAEIALRRVETGAARAALDRALEASRRAGIPALVSEIEGARESLEIPAARLSSGGEARSILLEEVESVLASGALIVDACRRLVHHRGEVVGLSRRPVLFGLAQALAEAWPGDAPRDGLIARVFEVRRANESHRARLRVDIGRLRREIRRVAEIAATDRGFVLRPRAARVLVLSPPIEGEQAALLALLADGGSWSTSALALALGSSQRSVQRALSSLEASGRVRSLGRARARRWLGQPLAGFTTVLLLPAPPAIG